MFTLGVLFTIVNGCSSVRYIPISSDTLVNVIDSIAWHDSTVVTYLTKERIVDVVPEYDTLFLETEYARAEARLDTTTHMLKGSIENKTDAPVKTEIKWKEKIVYRDSIVTKEVPVEVEKPVKVVPRIYKWSLGVCIGLLIMLVLYILSKLKLI